MNNVLLGIALTGLCGLVSTLIVGRNHILKVVDVSTIGIVIYVPFLVSFFNTSKNSWSSFLIALSISSFVVGLLYFLFDFFILRNIKILSPTQKALYSLSLLAILLASLNIVFEPGLAFQSPLTSSSLDQTNTSTLLIVIVMCLVVFAGAYLLIFKTTRGKKTRAFAINPIVASANGVSETTSLIICSILSAIFATVSGTGFALLTSQSQLSTSIIPLVVVCLGAVALARANKMSFAIFGSLITGIVQVISMHNIDKLADAYNWVASLLGAQSTVALDANVALYVLPVLTCLIFLNLLGLKMIKGTNNE